MKNILNHIINTYRRPVTYTILVRGSPSQSWKRIKVNAINYKQAVNKCCDLHKGKWINYTLARKMDLISARVDAAKESRDKGKPVFIILKDDEFELSTKETGDVYARFVNGTEDKEYLEVLKERDKQSTKNTSADVTSNGDEKVKVTVNKKQLVMETTEKTTAKNGAKKVVKKSPAKKVAAKKAAPKKAAKKSGEKKVRAIYGVGTKVLELLKKGGNYTKEALSKKFNAGVNDISFHLTVIRQNGHKVERTEKGYTLKK